jgi:hypothetical protein
VLSRGIGGSSARDFRLLFEVWAQARWSLRDSLQLLAM